MPPTLAHSCWGHSMGMEAVWQPSNDGSYSPRTHVIMLQRCPEIDGGFLYMIAKYLGLLFAGFGWCVRGGSSVIHCDLIHVSNQCYELLEPQWLSPVIPQHTHFPCQEGPTWSALFEKSTQFNAIIWSWSDASCVMRCRKKPLRLALCI